MEHAPAAELEQVQDVLVDQSEGGLDPSRSKRAQNSRTMSTGLGWTMGDALGSRPSATRRGRARSPTATARRATSRPPERDDRSDDREARRRATGAAPTPTTPRACRATARRAAAGLRRSAAGISSVTTAFVSCGISFSRKFAMRSSWRRYSRASFAVSLSSSASASVSIAM